MRRLFRSIIAGACLLPMISAAAEPQISVTHEEYGISGQTGAELMRQIRRKGPRHGVIGRAIAQTRYTLDYGYDSRASAGRCHAAEPWVHLAITFVYPRLDQPVSEDLRLRWDVFLHGAKLHEEGHADLAIRMAEAAERALRQVSAATSRGCVGLKNIVDREIKRIFNAHEAKQRRFDRLEHRQGGPVSRLVDALTAGTASAGHQSWR